MYNKIQRGEDMIDEWIKNPFFRYKPYKEYMDLSFDQIMDYYLFWIDSIDFSRSLAFNDFIRKQIVSSLAALFDYYNLNKDKK